MTLNLTFNCACRLCGTEFDPTETAPALTPGGQDNAYGRLENRRISLPRVARRHLLPNVCDHCWADFSRWMASKELAQHRVEAKAMKGERQYHYRAAEHTSYKYQKFSQQLLCEWLNEALYTHARIRKGACGELRNRVVEMATATHYHRLLRAQRYFDYERRSNKTERRNWTRYAPFCVPEWVKWQQGHGE